MSRPAISEERRGGLNGRRRWPPALGEGGGGLKDRPKGTKAPKQGRPAFARLGMGIRHPADSALQKILQSLTPTYLVRYSDFGPVGSVQ